MFSLFNKNDGINILLRENTQYDISLTKDEFKFRITIKETEEWTAEIQYVWFLYVEIKNEYHLCAFGPNKYKSYKECQDNALIYLNKMPDEFWTHIREKN